MLICFPFSGSKKIKTEPLKMIRYSDRNPFAERFLLYTFSIRVNLYLTIL